MKNQPTSSTEVIDEEEGLTAAKIAMPPSAVESIAMKAVVKDETFYVFGSRYRPREVIYDPELAELVRRGLVEQITVTVTPTAGYWIAVLPSKRAEFVTRASRKVVRLKPAEDKGFLILHAVRRKSIRYFRSFDTFVKTLMRYGPLPKIIVRQGPPI